MRRSKVKRFLDTVVSRTNIWEGKATGRSHGIYLFERSADGTSSSVLIIATDFFRPGGLGVMIDQERRIDLFFLFLPQSVWK